MRNRLVCAALAVALSITPAWPVAAQNGGYTRRVVTLYDYSSATETFCALDTASSQGPGPIAAAASNTVTGSSTFTNVAVGDELAITEGSNNYVVGVEARASASSITAAYRSPSTLASAALTLTAAQFRQRVLRCGTGADAGAFSTGYGPVSIQITVYRMAATGILWRLQCRTSPQSGWTQVYPVLTPPTTTASYITTTSAAVGGYTLSSIDAYDSCRVGVSVDTDAGIQAISITVSGRSA